MNTHKTVKPARARAGGAFGTCTSRDSGAATGRARQGPKAGKNGGERPEEETVELMADGIVAQLAKIRKLVAENAETEDVQDTALAGELILKCLCEQPAANVANVCTKIEAAICLLDAAAPDQAWLKKLLRSVLRDLHGLKEPEGV